MYPIEEWVAALRGALGIPEHVVLLCALSIGHPAEPSVRVDRYKPERVHLEQRNTCERRSS